jgi:hypothetical protein
MITNVKRSLERVMPQSDWKDAGQGWQGAGLARQGDQPEAVGWSRQRRIILLRRKLGRDLAVTNQTNAAQLRLSFIEVGPVCRDRADCENTFDELKNQWDWGGFTTHDLKRRRLAAGIVALLYNGGACSSVWPIRNTIARRSPAGRCCCLRSHDVPSMPAR